MYKDVDSIGDDFFLKCKNLTMDQLNDASLNVLYGVIESAGYRKGDIDSNGGSGFGVTNGDCCIHSVEYMFFYDDPIDADKVKKAFDSFNSKNYRCKIIAEEDYSVEHESDILSIYVAWPITNIIY